jgi:hypothetical protein
LKQHADQQQFGQGEAPVLCIHFCANNLSSHARIGELLSQGEVSVKRRTKREASTSSRFQLEVLALHHSIRLDQLHHMEACTGVVLTL